MNKIRTLAYLTQQLSDHRNDDVCELIDLMAESVNIDAYIDVAAAERWSRYFAEYARPDGETYCRTFERAALLAGVLNGMNR